MNRSQWIIGALGEAKSDQLELTVARDGGAVFQTGKSVTFPFTRNTESAKGFKIDKSQFQQNIEPAGRYMLVDSEPGRNPLPGWEKGSMTFKKPLVIPFNTGDDFRYDENSWKANLNKVFKKKGKALSRAIRGEGFDGIVTEWQGETREVVDLSVI